VLVSRVRCTRIALSSTSSMASSTCAAMAKARCSQPRLGGQVTHARWTSGNCSSTSEPRPVAMTASSATMTSENRCFFSATVICLARRGLASLVNTQ
jgi:hypothetical protein